MTNKDAAPVLVLGGTGHYGRHIVRHLLDKDQPVRVVSRDAGRARKVLGEDVQLLQGDIASRTVVAEALAGARGLVVAVSAFHPKLIRRMEEIERDAVLEVWREARRAGVSRAVYLSIYDIRQDVAGALDLDTARIKQEVEDELAASGLDWTVLGAVPSMDIFLALIRGNTMVVPGGGPPGLPTIAPADIGRITAQTVLRDDLGGQRIRMAGPEAISFPAAAQRISAATGQTLRFRRVPLLPLRLVAAVVGPFHPYLKNVVQSIRLMNHFPPEMVAQAQEDHLRLRRTFDYTPTTLETMAVAWAERR